MSSALTRLSLNNLNSAKNIKMICLFVATGSLRVQDHFLRAGIHAAATGGQRVQLVPQLRRHRSDVERRLHHPKVRLHACAKFPHVNKHQTCGRVQHKRPEEDKG